MTLFEGTGMLNENRGHNITRENYPKGFTLYAFDLTSDMLFHMVFHSSCACINVHILHTLCICAKAGKKVNIYTWLFCKRPMDQR
jgi:hypothetical protein